MPSSEKSSRRRPARAERPADPTRATGVQTLTELALDLRWSWNHSADEIWAQLEPQLWALTHNPWVVLQTVSRAKLQGVLSRPEYRQRVETLLEARRQHLARCMVYDMSQDARRGSVIASWLLDLTAAALIEDPDLARFSGRVSDSGEGRWTLDAAIDEAVPAHVLAAALFERFSSRGEAEFQDRLLPARRYECGGHLAKAPGR